MSVTFPKKPAEPVECGRRGAPRRRPFTSQSYLPRGVQGGGGLDGKHFFDNTKEMVLGRRPDPVLSSGYDEGITTISYPEQEAPLPRALPRHSYRLTAARRPRARAASRASAAPPRARRSASSSRPGEYPPGDKRRGYERFPVTLRHRRASLHLLRLLRAKHARATRSGWTPAVTPAPYDSRDQFIYAKDLLIGFTGRDGSRETANPRHEPGEASHPGIDREHAHWRGPPASVRTGFSRRLRSLRQRPGPSIPPPGSPTAGAPVCRVSALSGSFTRGSGKLVIVDPAPGVASLGPGLSIPPVSELHQGPVRSAPVR